MATALGSAAIAARWCYTSSTQGLPLPGPARRATDTTQQSHEKSLTMTTSSTNRSLDVLVGRLRKKLASVSSDYLIKNVQGKDYRLHRCGNRNKASQSTKRPATNRAAALKRGNDH